MARSAIRVWLLAAGLAGASTGTGDARADGRIERTQEFLAGVDSAIERGVAWLRTAQDPAGSFPESGGYPGGVTALAYHTLRVCGVAKDDPAAVRAFDALRQVYAAAKRRGELRTYAVGLCCMALAEHGQPQLATDQSGERLYALDAQDTAWMKELVKFLEESQDDRGRWSYGSRARRDDDAYDHSNTQYALLGLKAASRAGVRARTATWTKSLRHFLDAQEDAGKAVPRFEPGEKGRTSSRAMDRARGWGYVARGLAYGSMTAGGVGSVVICRSELLGQEGYPPALDAKAEQSLRDGIAWLGERLDVTTNPGPPTTMAGPTWHYYWLYALERAGVLAGVEWMGDHDWYAEGASFLIAEQLSRGCWEQGSSRRIGGPGPGVQRRNSESDVVVSTCFALLFLKRGTLPVRRGALTRSVEEDINFEAASSLAPADFDDFVDLVLSRWRRAPDEAARERLLARTTAVGARIVLPLVDRLSSTKDAERAAAFAALRRATGLDHGYDPAAERDAREDAVARWHSWWLANERTVRYDATAGRIVAK